MTIDISRWWEGGRVRRPSRAMRLRILRAGRHFFDRYRFNSITRRISVINVIGVGVLVSGIFYLNQSGYKFMGNRVETLTTQAQIIAVAIAQTSKPNTDAATESGKAADE